MKDKLSKPARAVYQSTVTSRQVDASTGEIISETKEEKHLTKTDGVGHLTFSKMFYTDLFKIYDMSKGAMVVFIELGAMMRDDKNHIIITSIERDILCTRTGLKKQAIYNATRELTASGLLQRVVSNVYMVDPNIFAIGTDPKVLQNRKNFESLKEINMQVKYTKEGRSVKVSME